VKRQFWATRAGTPARELEERLAAVDCLTLYELKQVEAMIGLLRDPSRSVGDPKPAQEANGERAAERGPRVIADPPGNQNGTL
jgi:hypothetical protein